MKKYILSILTCLLILPFLSAATYIDSCQTLNQAGETYYLSENITETTFRCISILAPNITLDCQGNSIISPYEKHMIYVKGDYTTIKNCKVSTSIDNPKPSYRGGAIVVSSDYNLIENNEVFNSFYGMFITGDYNLVKNNIAYGNEKGILVNFGERNIIQENIARNNNRGFGVWYAEKNRLANNKAYNNKNGFYIMPLQTRIVCGVSQDNSNSDIYLYGTNVARLINIYGGDYEIIKKENYVQVNKHLYDCQTNYCTWFGDECLFDRDRDNVPDNEDLCLNTPADETAIVYGCSCTQILELKPGKDKGELKNGCSKGTINVFTEMIGWAKDLFE